MSKKIWNRIFKSKSAKASQKITAANLSKINKRNSIYEEYQQLNTLLYQHQQLGNSEKLTVYAGEQSAPSFDDTPLPATLRSSSSTIASCKQSKFSRVVNSFSLKRHTQPDKSHNHPAGGAERQQEKNCESSTHTTMPSLSITNNTNARSATAGGEGIENSQSPIAPKALIVVNPLMDCQADAVSDGTSIHQQSALSPALASTPPATTAATVPVADGCEQNEFPTNRTAADLHVRTNNQEKEAENGAERRPLPPAALIAEEPAPDVELKLTSCPVCARRFNPATYKKHVPICEKAASKKRKVFDSSRQRREGTDLASYPLPKGYGLPPVPKEATSPAHPNHQTSPPPPHLQKQSSEELVRSTVRSSVRKQSNGSVTSGSGVPAHTTGTPRAAPPAATSTPVAASGGSGGGPGGGGGNFNRDRMRSSERTKRTQQPQSEQCPHCDRSFGLKAYDRHVDWCKEKALLASIKQSKPKTEQNLAKERLEARTKYRAPCLKSKRTLNREKYSGVPGEENELGSSTNTTNNNSIMSLSMTSSITSESAQAVGHRGNQESDAQAERVPVPVPVPEPDEQRVSKKGLPERDFYLAEEEHEITDSLSDFQIHGEEITIAGRKKSKRNAKYAVEPKKSCTDLTADEVKMAASYNEANATRDHKELASALTVSKSETGLPSSGRKTKPKSNVPVRLRQQALQVKPILRGSIDTVPAQQQQQQQQLAVKATVSEPALATSEALHSAMTLAEVREHQKAMFISATVAETVAAAHASSGGDPGAKRQPPMRRPKKKSLLPSATRSLPLKALPLSPQALEEMERAVPELDLIKEYSDKELKVIKAPPAKMRSASSAKELAGKCGSDPLHTIKLSRNRSFVLSGLASEKYDPFLSAKRQLEELCSPTPSSPPRDVLDALKIPLTPPAAFAGSPKSPFPATPKMVSSLNLGKASSPSGFPSAHSTQSASSSSSYQHSSPLSASAAAPERTFSNLPSNFRRTSSLRGPRRSPLLSSKPLFAQKPRPTIQRGISDEGPISSSFLKPEEYDEMPVRAVCVNDFAVAKSPRVVRRDTSLSNRKNSLKLALAPPEAAAKAGEAPTTATATATAPTSGPAQAVGKDLSKTDSLAVFLKYETELEKLNQAMPTPTPTPTPTPNCTATAITKELKDKSNTLSKQNSAKSIRLEPLELPEAPPRAAAPAPSSTVPTTGPSAAPCQAPAPRQAPAPAQAAPLSQTAAPVQSPASQPAHRSGGPVRLEPLPKPTAPQSVSLDAILTGPKTPSVMATPKPASTLAAPVPRERKLSSSTEFIDPQLINKCDNLPVQAGGEGVAKQLDRIDRIDRIERLEKQLTHSNKLPAPEMGFDGGEERARLRPRTSPLAGLGEQLAGLHMGEGRNQLRMRRMRLGRNHFLYDASPEGDSCSPDDEANRSSAELDEEEAYPRRASMDLLEEELLAQSLASTIPSLPPFDDFDFEKFLSSFENDEEQLPLFKDCKEFLLNRTGGKQRHHTPFLHQHQHRNQHHHHNNTSHTNTASRNNNNHNHNHSIHEHLQFPRLAVTASAPARRSNTTVLSKAPVGDLSVGEDSESELKKREIFISIETEQNELGRSPISPRSLRHMVGNSQTQVEVEMDANANDNKFRKISDDDDADVDVDDDDDDDDDDADVDVDVDDDDADDDEDIEMGRHEGRATPRSGMAPFRNAHRLPNVQLNNAKNLMQKMQEDFRQLGREASGVGVGTGAGVERRLSQRRHLKAPTGVHNNNNNSSNSKGGSSNHHDAGGESDELSSIDSYPISSQSSRRAVTSKHSADSAYGSLSRQRSVESNSQSQASSGRPPSSRGRAANPIAPQPASGQGSRYAATQQQQQQQEQQQQQQQQQQTHHRHNSKTRARLVSAVSSSSGSDNSLPPIVGTKGYQKCTPGVGKQLHAERYKYTAGGGNNNSNNNNNSSASNNATSNARTCESPISSPDHGHLSNQPSMMLNKSMHAGGGTTTTSATGSGNLHASLLGQSQSQSHSSTSSINSSTKMSKFCHECGQKFVIEHAKFCMDCGARRLVL